jgi:hypothetical protein
MGHVGEGILGEIALLLLDVLEDGDDLAAVPAIAVQDDL